jgi:hypothetical protein
LPGTVRVVGEEIIAIPERPASRIIAAAVEWVVVNLLRSVSTVPPSLLRREAIHLKFLNKFRRRLRYEYNKIQTGSELET